MTNLLDAGIDYRHMLLEVKIANFSAAVWNIFEI